MCMCCVQELQAYPGGWNVGENIGQEVRFRDASARIKEEIQVCWIKCIEWVERAVIVVLYIFNGCVDRFGKLVDWHIEMCLHLCVCVFD